MDIIRLQTHQEPVQSVVFLKNSDCIPERWQLLTTQFAVVLALSFACRGEDLTFKRTKLSSSVESSEVAAELLLSDTQIVIRSSLPGRANLRIPYSVVTKIAYTESSRHRLTEGAKIALISPGIGAATILSKKRTEWLSISWVEAGTPLETTLWLDKREATDIRAALESRTGKSVEELDEKINPFDPTTGSMDVDKVVPFGRDQVSGALRTAMEGFGCKVTKETPSVIRCRRQRGHSELTGLGGEQVIATLDEQASQTHIVLTTKKASVQNRNWSTVVFRKMEEGLASGK